MDNVLAAGTGDEGEFDDSTRAVRLLLVGDSPHIQRLAIQVRSYVSEVENTDIDIARARTVEDALERIKTIRAYRATTDAIACVVSAYELPERDGLQFLEHLDSKRPHIPFVLAPESGNGQVASRAIGQGAADYVPWDLDDHPNHETAAERIVDLAVDRRVSYGGAEEQRDYERQLERQRFLYERIQEIANVGIYEYDVHSDLVDWSQGVYDIHGVDMDFTPTPEEVFELVHPEDRDMVASEFERAMEERSGFDLEVRIRRPNGSIRYIRLQGEIITGREGNPTTLRGVVQDITRLKRRQQQAEQARNELRQVLDVVPDPIYTMSADGEFLMANEAMAELYDTTVEELVGRTDDEFEADLVTDQCYDAMDEALATGSPQSIRPLEVTDAYGDEHIVQSDKIPIDIEGREDTVILSYVRDVTELKERERSIRHLHDATRELVRADTAEEAAETVAEAAAEILEHPNNVVRLQDEDDGLLYPVAVSEGVKQLLGEDRPVYEVGQPTAGKAFAEGETIVYDDLRELDDDIEHSPGASMYIPIGEYGVLTISDTEPGAFDDAEVNVAEILAANAAEALERIEGEEEIKRLTERLELAIEGADFGIWDMDIPSDSIELDERAAGIADYSPDEIGDFEWIVDRIHPDDRTAYIDAVQDHFYGDADRIDVQFRIQNAAGAYTWVRAVGRVVEWTDDDQPERAVGVVLDIHRQKRYEHSLEAVNTVARDAIHAESHQELARLVVNGAADVLNLPAPAIYLFDEQTAQLHPTAFVDDRGIDQYPTVEAGDSPIWRAFANQEPIVDGHDAHADAGEMDMNGHQVIFPLGDHGVFVAGGTADDRVDDLTIDIVEILAATAEAALDRAATTYELRRQKQQSQEQAEQLEEVYRLTEEIRSINRVLVDADSYDEIYTAICDAIIQHDRFDSAWVAQPDYASGELTVQAMAGAPDSLQEMLTLDLDGNVQAPHLQAVRTEDLVVESDISEGVQEAEWRNALLMRDYRSAVSVPLYHGGEDGVLYGILTLYSQDAGAVDDDLTQNVLSELGELIGYSLRMLDQQNALFGDEVVSLTFLFEECSHPLLALSSEIEGTLDVASVTPRQDDSYLAYLSVDPDETETVVDQLESAPQFSDVRTLSASDPALIEAVMTEGIIWELVELGAKFRSAEVDGAQVEVELTLSDKTDVQMLAGRFQTKYPGADLISQQWTTTDDEQSVPTSPFEPLTERQYDILEAAYFRGFFENPRESSGSEVADSLGISQPGFSKQRRAAIKNILDAYLSDSRRTPQLRS